MEMPQSDPHAPPTPSTHRHGRQYRSLRNCADNPASFTHHSLRHPIFRLVFSGQPLVSSGRKTFHRSLNYFLLLYYPGWLLLGTIVAVSTQISPSFDDIVPVINACKIHSCKRRSTVFTVTTDISTHSSSPARWSLQREPTPNLPSDYRQNKSIGFDPGASSSRKYVRLNASYLRLPHRTYGACYASWPPGPLRAGGTIDSP